MSATAVLTCRPNSFPFQERRVPLHEPQKIGRSVARARPGPNNGIFDCKVLSRNHALMWYADGKFFLQDTKSSNGTFVNNERLSRGSEESSPREIFFGDIIQFGVDVMESNRRGEKVTHACIIATVTLYDPSGAEARVKKTEGEVKPGANVKSLEMYQLYQYLQEALHREKMLETKLNSLEWLIKNTQESCDTGWQALIDEDRLLSRIDVLEGQLLNYSKAHCEDTLRQELTALQEDKHNYETTAKESLRRVLQEKLDAIKKCSDLELSLSNTELECSHEKDICETSQKELHQLAERYDEKVNEIVALQAELQEAEQKHSEEQERVEVEKEELHDKLSSVLSQEAVLSAKIESLQAENDFAGNQLTAIKSKLEMYKEKKLLDSDYADDINVDDIIPLYIMKPEDSLYEEQLKEKQKEIKQFTDKIDESEKNLEDSKEKVERLQKELEMAELDSRQYIARIASLEAQLTESCKQSEGNASLVKSLEASINKLEGELSACRISHAHPTKLSADEPQRLCDVPQTTATADANEPTKLPITSTDTPITDRQPVDTLMDEETKSAEGQLFETKAKLVSVLQELTQNKGELDKSQLLVSKQHCEIIHLRSELSTITNQSEDRSHTITELHAQLKNSNNVAKDTEQQILSLKEQLHKSQQTAKQYKSEADHLKGEVSSLKDECGRLREKIVMMESQMKVSHKENLQLSSEYNKLQEAYRVAEVATSKLVSGELGTQGSPNDSMSDALNQSQPNLSQVDGAKQEGTLKGRISEYETQIDELNGKLGDMHTRYRSVAEQSRMLSLCSTIPLLVLMFATLLAIYPLLETITATSS